MPIPDTSWPSFDLQRVVFWWKPSDDSCFYPLWGAPRMVRGLSGHLFCWISETDSVPVLSEHSPRLASIGNPLAILRESLESWRLTGVWANLQVDAHAARRASEQNRNIVPKYWQFQGELGWVPLRWDEGNRISSESLDVLIFYYPFGGTPQQKLEDILAGATRCGSTERLTVDEARQLHTAYYAWLNTGLVYSLNNSPIFGNCDRCDSDNTRITPVSVGACSRDTENWCEECLAHTTHCTDCGESVDESEIVSDRHDSYCPRCMEDRFVCDACYQINESLEANSINGVDVVCDNCFRQYQTCSNCGVIDLRDNMYCRDDWYCSDCDPGEDSEEDEGASDLIHSYSYKPSPDFRGDGPRYFGVELEVEVMGSHSVDDCAGQVCGHFQSFAYLKSDGSLDRGFEIVTHPASLAYHRKKWQGFYTPQVCKGLKSYQTNTCGLHVHISREAASELTWSKFVSFVSDPNHRRITETIAMRSSKRWAQYSTKKVGSRDELRIGGHDQAVNCENRKTIEVRIFKGTLRGLSVIRAIEYCDSVLSWVKDTSIASLTYDSYFCWLRKRRKDYAELWSFLEAKSLVAPAAKLNPNNLQPTKETEEVMVSCV